MDRLIDERELSRLRWRCRRGLLENDLFVERFFQRQAGQITEAQARALLLLMDLPDHDLLDLLLARREPSGELMCEDVTALLLRLRRPSAVPGADGAMSEATAGVTAAGFRSRRIF